VEDAGCKMLTLHARTKKDGYTHPARWDYIKEAKKELKIPVCGNGDITSAQSAIDMLELTGCDHLMIGRQAAKDPFIFHRIRCALEGRPFKEDLPLLFEGLRVFFHEILKRHSPMGSIKQLGSYLFSQDLEIKKGFLTQGYQSAQEAIDSFYRACDKLHAVHC
jgi:tRNA-dihydrouridine synthase